MDLTNKTVLVTGAGGFIGGHLVEALVAKGCRVNALVSYNSASSQGTLDQLPAEVMANVSLFRGDLRDRGTVVRAMTGADAVFHLAALAGVLHSFDSPESYVGTNISGTLNILEEAKRLSLERVLITSSSAVYGRPKYLPVDELHPVEAATPYAATKIAADRIAESYYRSFELPVTIVRPFNTYGPRQSTRAIIPSIIEQLFTGHDIIKAGNISPTRDMVFVDDTVHGFLEIAQSQVAIGEEINLASGVETSIGSIIETLISIINPSACIEIDPLRQRKSNGSDRLYGCSKKLSELCGWKPETSLENGLQRTVEWFVENKNFLNLTQSTYQK